MLQSGQRAGREKREWPGGWELLVRCRPQRPVVSLEVGVHVIIGKGTCRGIIQREWGREGNLGARQSEAVRRGTVPVLKQVGECCFGKVFG